MGRALDPKKIKSAQRVLEVLEYFNNDRGEATVMDIARSMGYPQSSTSELLSCLVALGYLHRDRYARTYKPTARVALLGAWVQPTLFRHGRLLPMMDQLAEEADATVVLATKSGLDVSYIHVISPTKEEELYWSTGAKAPLLHSAVGKALLSTTDSELVRKLVHRLNAESEADMRVSYDSLATDLRDIRANGYAVGLLDSGGGMASVLLPQASSEEQLVLGICGLQKDFAEKTEDYVRMLRNVVARHLGPIAVSPPALPQSAPSQFEPFSADLVRRYG
jgi:DNA-binding IclR family transcriptional regulator